MFKADIDSAFRRLPVAPTHRRYACVAFLAEGSLRIMRHNAMPFGAIASVVHWDRIGAILCRAPSFGVMHV